MSAATKFWRRRGGSRRSRGQRPQRFRRDGEMPHAARFQIFDVLDGGVEQLPVTFGHGIIVAAARRSGNPPLARFGVPRSRGSAGCIDTSRLKAKLQTSAIHSLGDCAFVAFAG